MPHRLRHNRTWKPCQRYLKNCKAGKEPRPWTETLTGNLEMGSDLLLVLLFYSCVVFLLFGFSFSFILFCWFFLLAFLHVPMFSNGYRSFCLYLLPCSSIFLICFFSICYYLIYSLALAWYFLHLEPTPLDFAWYVQHVAPNMFVSSLCPNYVGANVLHIAWSLHACLVFPAFWSYHLFVFKATSQVKRSCRFEPKMSHVD